MSLTELLGVLTPPIHPADPAAPDGWRSIESSIGTPLPEDYKRYIETFGTGGIDGFIWIFNPLARNPNVNLIQQIPSELEALRALKHEVIPFPLFPEIGGLLPFGATDNGNVLYWLTRGNPEDWPIVIYEGRGPKHQVFKLEMTALVAKLLAGTVRCDVFPTDFPRRPASFSPAPQDRK